MNTLRRFIRPLAALLLTAASLPALAIAPFKADYRASYMGLQADGVMQLERQQGNRWRYSLQVRNQMADLRQSTVFDIHNGHLRPLSSEDSANLLIKRRSIQADYDWADRQAVWRGDLRAGHRGRGDPALRRRRSRDGHGPERALPGRLDDAPLRPARNRGPCRADGACPTRLPGGRDPALDA